MPQSKQLPKNYYTQFPKDTNQIVHEDSRLQWDALYNLKSKLGQAQEITLTNNFNLDTDLTAGQLVIWLISQDTVGGWTPTWAKNPDNSKKWFGTNKIVWTTTANTYTGLLFWASRTTSANLLAFISGGDLS